MAVQLSVCMQNVWGQKSVGFPKLFYLKWASYHILTSEDSTLDIVKGFCHTTPNINAHQMKWSLAQNEWFPLSDVTAWLLEISHLRNSHAYYYQNIITCYVLGVCSVGYPSLSIIWREITSKEGAPQGWSPHNTKHQCLKIEMESDPKQVIHSVRNVSVYYLKFY